jgi:dTDP-N-acetylfucosamine:lipid II N-acetylfucosaminyltransferase
LYQQQPFGAYKKCIAQLDYFCFWNNYDYELLKKHFTTTATYKQFLYYNLIDRNYTNISFAKQQGKVLINHSASANGNHLTILQKLKQILPQDNEVNIITPLSYGSESIKNEVINTGTNLFGKNFTPIVNYMPIDEYYNLLNNIPVAIFGSKRQEGGGNIFYMLGKGAKVFLRNNNNMMQWLKDHGFYIFSVEDDLLSAKDLLPLSTVQMETNIAVHKKLFSESSELNNIGNLIAAAQ